MLAAPGMLPATLLLWSLLGPDKEGLQDLPNDRSSAARGVGEPPPFSHTLRSFEDPLSGHDESTANSVHSPEEPFLNAYTSHISAYGSVFVIDPHNVWINDCPPPLHISTSMHLLLPHKRRPEAPCPSSHLPSPPPPGYTPANTPTQPSPSLHHFA